MVAGFVGSETLATSGVTGQPLLTLVGDGMHVGQYSITVGTGSLAATNYDFPDLVNGLLTVTPAALTITADNKSKVYGAALPALTASYGGFVNGDTPASLDMLPTLSTTATASSHVADYPIMAGGATSSDYTIGYADGTLSVTPASLTITADGKSKVYGAAIAQLTAAYDGLVNGDTPASLDTPPSLATTAAAASHVGNYPITIAGAADSDYIIDLVDGLYDVTPAPLTIMADNKSKVYGAAIAQLTAAYDGLVNGDTPANLDTPPTLSTPATIASSVGSYPISAAAAADPDYTINLVPGVYQVTPAPLTIKADDKTKSAGEANPPLTFTLIGLVNNDTVAALVTQPTLITAATTGSPAGTYPITASGASSPNYTISYSAGTMTVTSVVAGGTIGGSVYFDVTGNGLSPDDTGFAIVQVYLDANSNGAFDLGEPATTSLPDGTYALSGVAAGTYQVRQITPSGHVRTDPAVDDYHVVALADGETASGNDFANALLGDASAVANIVYVINGTTAVSNLVGKTREGDTVQVSFTVVPGAQSIRYSSGELYGAVEGVRSEYGRPAGGLPDRHRRVRTWQLYARGPHSAQLLPGRFRDRQCDRTVRARRQQHFLLGPKPTDRLRQRRHEGHGLECRFAVGICLSRRQQQRPFDAGERPIRRDRRGSKLETRQEDSQPVDRDRRRRPLPVHQPGSQQVHHHAKRSPPATPTAPTRWELQAGAGATTNSARSRSRPAPPELITTLARSKRSARQWPPIRPPAPPFGTALTAKP